ncbi:MAG: hypothetical protein IT289_07850, partial [Oligoflexia bacterium]|nr:hypothetical protein [Oligoflexia bacterium]
MIWKSLIFAVAITITAPAFAVSELDAEIQDLELSLRPIKKAAPRPVARPKVSAKPKALPRVTQKPAQKVARSYYQSAPPTDP